MTIELSEYVIDAIATAVVKKMQDPSYNSIKTELEPCEDAISRQAVLDINERHHGQMPNHVNHEIWKEIKALPSVTPQPKPNIKALGEDIRICQKSITDKKVLIGFNMAVALCNKHLAESE